MDIFWNCTMNKSQLAQMTLVSLWVEYFLAELISFHPCRTVFFTASKLHGVSDRVKVCDWSNSWLYNIYNSVGS